MLRKVLQDGAVATGDGEDINTRNKGECVFQVEGTFSATIQFEGSVSGTWVAIQATNMNDDTSATTATAAGLYKVRHNVGGLVAVRANITVYASGSVTITACAE